MDREKFCKECKDVYTPSMHMSLSLSLSIYIYIYIYMYVCVLSKNKRERDRESEIHLHFLWWSFVEFCVCVCVCVRACVCIDVCELHAGSVNYTHKMYAHEQVASGLFHVIKIKCWEMFSFTAGLCRSRWSAETWRWTPCWSRLLSCPWRAAVPHFVLASWRSCNFGENLVKFTLR